MNFVGHHEVAVRRGLDAPARLGAMLPDFATMLGIRLQPDALDAAVRAGVELHHRTDAVFHPLDDVRRGMQQLTAAVADRGVGRGAARAIGHVGYEMLVDSMLEPIALRDTIERAGDDPGVATALAGHPEWPTMRGHLATRVAHYDDPEWVAVRLFHILERRPRLAFPADRLAAVIDALATAAPGVRAVAPSVLATVVAATYEPS
jgi:hypothetical protein